MATTKKQAEMFQFPAFDVNKMSETYRDYTEKAMAQSKENYAKMKEAAEGAADHDADALRVRRAALALVDVQLRVLDGLARGRHREVRVAVVAVRALRAREPLLALEVAHLAPVQRVDLVQRRLEIGHTSRTIMQLIKTE